MSFRRNDFLPDSPPENFSDPLGYIVDATSGVLMVCRFPCGLFYPVIPNLNQMVPVKLRAKFDESLDDTSHYRKGFWPLLLLANFEIHAVKLQDVQLPGKDRFLCFCFRRVVPKEPSSQEAVYGLKLGGGLLHVPWPFTGDILPPGLVGDIPLLNDLLMGKFKQQRPPSIDSQTLPRCCREGPRKEMKRFVPMPSVGSSLIQLTIFMYIRPFDSAWVVISLGSRRNARDRSRTRNLCLHNPGRFPLGPGGP